MVNWNIINEYKYWIIIILIYLTYIKKLKYDKILSKAENSNFLHSHEKYNKVQPNNLTEKNEKKLILENGRKYLDKCLNTKNIEFYEVNKNPIITNIIPSYNCEKTIIASIHSIQYQNFSNFEIIIVDDCSSDNSREIIKNIQINDKRIKLIENKRNMGTLYSRCLGALLSKANYILCLDNDDLFFDGDVFDFLHKQSIKDNLDLVSFRALEINNYFDGTSKMKYYRFYGFQNNFYLSQPDLGIWTISLNGKFCIHDNEIWLKYIKSNIYKKAVNILGIKRYSKYICWAEDTNINFIIFNIAQSFKYVNKIGYIHIRRNSSASYKQNINRKLFGELFFLDVMFDFSKNNSDKNFAVSYSFYLKNRYKLNQYTNNTNYNYLKFILNKIIESQFITTENKQKIKNSFKSFFNF